MSPASHRVSLEYNKRRALPIMHSQCMLFKPKPFLPLKRFSRSLMTLFYKNLAIVGSMVIDFSDFDGISGNFFSVESLILLSISEFSVNIH